MQRLPSLILKSHDDLYVCIDLLYDFKRRCDISGPLGLLYDD